MRERRRRALMIHAAEVLARGGYHHTGMDEIAADKGQSKIALYRYFGTKKALMEGILTEAQAVMAEADRLWWAEPADGQNLKRALAYVRQHRAFAVLLMEFAPTDRSFSRFYTETMARTRANTSMRLARWMGRTEEPTPLWNVQSDAIAEFAINNFMRWIEFDNPDTDDAFLTLMAINIGALARSARACFGTAGSEHDMIERSKR